MYLAKMSEGSKTVVTDIGGLESDHVPTSSESLLTTMGDNKSTIGWLFQSGRIIFPGQATSSSTHSITMYFNFSLPKSWGCS